MKRVDLNEVCNDHGIRHIPYTKYWTEVPPIADQTDGMAFYANDGTPTILYDDRKTPSQIRFTVAHELGHLFLNHLKGGPAEELKERWDKFMNSPTERETDLFAAVLLAYDLLCQYGTEAA